MSSSSILPRLPDCNKTTGHDVAVDDAADPGGHVHHRQHDHHAENQHLVVVVVAGQVVDDGHDDGADDPTPDVADAAQHDHEQQRHHLGEHVAVGVDESRGHVRPKAAGTTGVQRAEHEGERLVFLHVDPRGGRCKRVLAQRLEGATDAGLQDAEGKIDPGQRQRHHHVVVAQVRPEHEAEQIRRWNVADADRGAEVIGGRDEDPDRFRQPERGQGKVGALQPKRRDTDDRAG